MAVGASTRFDIRRFFDDGSNGDSVAGDNVFTTTVAIPPASEGEYELKVTAETVIDGKTLTASSTVPIRITGQASDAPSVTTTVLSDNYPDILKDERCTLRVEVSYPGGASPEGTRVTVGIIKPDSSIRISPVASRVSPGVYEAEYTFWEIGRYTIDVKALPPLGSSFAPGYGQINVHVGRGPLSVASLTSQGPYKLLEPIPLRVGVTFEGQPVEGATVIATLSGPLSESVAGFSFADGVYQAVFCANVPGEYSVEFVAQAADFLAGTGSGSLRVSSDRGQVTGALLTLVSDSKSCFDMISEEAKRCAAEADSFAREKTKDKIELLMDLAFDLCNVVTAGSKSSAEAVEKTKDFIKVRFPGWDKVVATKQAWAPFKKMFPAAIRQVVVSTITVEAAPTLSRSLAQGALVYCGAALLDKLAEDVVKRGAKETLTNLLTEKTVTQVYTGALASLSEDLELDLQETLEAKLSAMPALQPEDEEHYASDLSLRRAANGLFVHLLQTQAVPLHRAWEETERQNKDFLAWLGNKLLHAAPTIVALLADGPGWVFVVAEGAFLAYDAYMNSQEISDDDRMHHLGFDVLKRACDDALDIYFNSTSGILGIQEGGASEILPSAYIETVSDFSKGQWRISGWAEKEAYSEVTVRNLGEQALFRLFSEYLSNGIPGVTETFKTAEGETPYVITLGKDQVRTLRVYYHDKKMNVTPDGGRPVFYYLLAYTNNGRYLVHTYIDQEFDPERASTKALSAQSLQEPEPPTVCDDVVRSWVVQDEDSLAFEIRISLGNPFPCPLSPKITQELPEGLEISEAIGGVVEGRTALWLLAIHPHISEELILRVQRKAPPEQEILVSGTQVEIYDPSTGQTVVFASHDITLAPVMPVRCEVSCPVELVPRYESNLLCQVRNLLQADVSAELLLQIAAASGGAFVSHIYPVSLGPGEKSNLILPIVEDVAPGEYVLNLTLAYGAIGQDLYAGWLTVLADEDSDGMPTNWETLNGLDPAKDDAGADNDGDGLSNYDEYVAETNPKDPANLPHPSSIGKIAGTPNLELKLDGAAGRIYELEWSEDGITWHKGKGGGTVQVGRGTSLTFIDDGLSTGGDTAYAPGSVTVRKKFYRIGIRVR